MATDTQVVNSPRLAHHIQVVLLFMASANSSLTEENRCYFYYMVKHLIFDS